jgi:hypothetical protein
MKLLSVPKLHDGAVVTMMYAVVESIDKWGLHNRIKGLCFNKTACNMGQRMECASCWRKEIGRDQLNLTCRRHHIGDHAGVSFQHPC